MSTARRERKKFDDAASATPFHALTEPDYRYQVAKFHDLRAATAVGDERMAFAFRDGDHLFKIAATGGKAEIRREKVAAVAEAIWNFRHPD